MKFLNIASVCAVCLLISACSVIKSTSSPAFQTLYDSFFSPILSSSMKQRGIPEESREIFLDAARKKLKTIITDYMTEKEIGEVNVILASKKFQNTMRNYIDNNQLTEEDSIFLEELRKTSPGFVKFTSKEFQTKITNAIVEIIEQKQKQRDRPLE